MNLRLPVGDLLVLAIVTLMFSVIVGYGWHHLLMPYTGSFWASLVLSLFLVFLALAVARHTALFFAKSQLNLERVTGPRAAFGFFLYLPLLFISIFGTLNTMFLVAEARSILRDDSRSIRDEFTLLVKDASTILATPSLDRKTSAVNGLLTSLRSEIDSPVGGGFCGVGPEAERLIAQLRQELPTFQRINGSGPIRPCDRQKADELASAYERNARAVLASHPDVLARSGPDRVRLREAIRSDVEAPDGPVTALSAVEALAQGVGPIRTEWLTPLVVAQGRYNTHSGELDAFATTDGVQRDSRLSLPTPISESINSYAGTIPILLSRLDKPTSWFYILLAVAIDIWLIFTMYRFAMFLGRRDQDTPRYDLRSERRFLIDPRYIGRA